MSLLDYIPESVKRKVVFVLILLGALGWFLAAWYGRCTHAASLSCCSSGICGEQGHHATLKRTFHPYTIAQVTVAEPGNWHGKFLTHIEVEGWLTYKSHEQDGDWHLRLCDDAKLVGMDAKRCIVAECIPELPCSMIPKLGQHVRVRGMGRYDAENPGHHWFECHPVTSIEVIP